MNKLFKKYKIAILLILSLFLFWVLSTFYPFTFDLTEDRRYSLSDATISLIDSQTENIRAEVLFEGEFPAGYQNLRDEVENILKRFRSINPRFSLEFINPLEGSDQEVKERMEQFAQIGLMPFPIRFESESEFKAVQAFPYVIFSSGQKNVIVNIIEGSVVGPYSEENLNKAISRLEYKMANSIKKINQSQRKRIGILEGHGEFDAQGLFMLRSELSRYYETYIVNQDSIDLIPLELDLLIVSSPDKAFKDDHIFQLDHYINQGGHVIWLIDKFSINSDSIDKGEGYIPLPRRLGLENLFFKHGVRINDDVILDLECSTIPIVTATPSGQPQMESFPWYYHPLVLPNEFHPITGSIDRVNLFYPSSIEILNTLTVNSSILLSTSHKTRISSAPFNLTFEILRYPPDVDMFQQGPLPVAVILEGSFPPLYNNRLPAEFQEKLNQAGQQLNASGRPSKQLFVSDADFILTQFLQQNGEPLPMGYNKGERRKYQGNEDFILNAVEYMMGDGDILASKAKSRKLYLLDKVKAKSEKTWWQVVNILFPLLSLLVFGLIFNFWRKKKYT
jgi:gliding-associated putative ABC transporter substrate-binding component GldG